MNLSNETKTIVVCVVAILVLVVVALYAKHASADDEIPGFVISWEPPTERADGSALPAEEIAKYQIYVYAPDSDKPTRAGSETKGTSWEYRREDLYPGLWCFHVETEDTEKVRSDPSEKQCIDYQGPVEIPTVPDPEIPDTGVRGKPKPPTDIEVIFQLVPAP